MKSTFKGLRLAVILLAVYWVLIFIGTHLPPRALVPIRANDKLLHTVAFTGLSFLAAWAIPTRPSKPFKNVLLAVVACVVYAIFDELSQIPVGRTADFRDFVADCVGISIGTSLYVTVRGIFSATGRTFLEPRKRPNLDSEGS